MLNIQQMTEDLSLYVIHYFSNNNFYFVFILYISSPTVLVNILKEFFSNILKTLNHNREIKCDLIKVNYRTKLTTLKTSSDMIKEKQYDLFLYKYSIFFI